MKKLSKKDFNAIKALQKIGVSKSEIKEDYNYSNSLFFMIKKFDTYEEYREYKKNIYTKKDGKATNSKPEITKESKEIKETIAYKMPELERIAEALEKLVIAWETSPKKKGFLK